MSKFDKLFEARESAEAAPPDTKRKNTPKKKSNKPAPEAVTEVAQASHSSTTPVQTQQQKKRGRPQAKRSDPDFIGFTTYIRKDTHRNVKIALLQEGKERELSELVEELLSKWLKNV